MAVEGSKTDALSILTSKPTKDKLAELSGKLIDSIQKEALSSRLKNAEYSGDPTTGSIEIARFKNSEAASYGTARGNSKGSALENTGKVIINIDQDKEIVEEIEKKDLMLYGIAGLADRRTANHRQRVIADLDREFFQVAETEGTDAKLEATDIVEATEEIIQKLETVKNDWVDGLDRSDIVITATPKVYGLLRTYIDTVTDGGAHGEAINLFHGVEILSNTRQTKGLIAMRKGSIGQLVLVNQYDAERIGLSNAFAIELFYSYGTKAITKDLIFWADFPKTLKDEMKAKTLVSDPSYTRYKSVKDIQENIEIVGDKITGTLKHIADFTPPFAEKDKKGYFISLDLDAAQGVKIKTKIYKPESEQQKELVEVNDGFCVYKVSDKDTQKILVVFEGENGQKWSEEYDLSGLTLAPKENEQE